MNSKGKRKTHDPFWGERWKHGSFWDDMSFVIARLEAVSCALGGQDVPDSLRLTTTDAVRDLKSLIHRAKLLYSK